MTRKNEDKSTDYKISRYFVPASITASQTSKSRRWRARRCKMHTPLTYRTLFEEQERTVLLENKSRQTAANRATALRAFMRANGLQMDDVVGDELRMRHPEALERFMETLRADGRSQRSITNTRCALRPWKEAVVEYDTIRALEADQPTPFARAIGGIMKGHPTKRVARLAGIPSDMLYGWLQGKTPRVSSYKFILRLEAFFGLDPQSLVQTSGIKLVGKRREPVGGSPAPIEYRDRTGRLTRICYAVKPGPGSPLRQQWKELMEYKTAAVAKYKRTKRGRWRISPCPLTARTDANWWAFLDGREVASAKMIWSKTASFLGWLRLSREAGGMQIPEDQVETIAWLAIPDFLERFMDWMMERAGVRNQGQMQFLATIASLVRPRFGYLRQRPELQRTLPAQYQDEQWEQLCDRQFELVEQLVSAYHGEIGVSRNSFDPIRSVIDLPQPMDAVADMVQRMRADRPVGKHARYEAVWARNLVLIKLLASNALRRRNLAHLTWRADNTGHLYQKEDRSWWIHIPRQQFKNTCGAAGDFDYDSPVHPSAWADIEKYLFVHRKMMMRGPTDLVFLTLEDRRSAGKNRPWLEMSATVSALTNRYLLRSPGIGPHAFRHIVATSILKADGGDHKTAAKVLNDRVSTVEKHYAGLRSADGAVRMAELLDGPFSRM